jgi:hypothetical protein
MPPLSVSQRSVTAASFPYAPAAAKTALRRSHAMRALTSARSPPMQRPASAKPPATLPSTASGGLASASRSELHRSRSFQVVPNPADAALPAPLQVPRSRVAKSCDGHEPLRGAASATRVRAQACAPRGQHKHASGRVSCVSIKAPTSAHRQLRAQPTADTSAAGIMPRLLLEPRGAPGSTVSTRPPHPTAAVSRCAAATSAATRCCEAAGWRSARWRRRDASGWRAGRPASHAQAAGGAPAWSRRPSPCQRISSQALRVRAIQRPSQRMFRLRLRRSASLQQQVSSPPSPAACEPPPPQPLRACAPAAGARSGDGGCAAAVTPAASDPAQPASYDPRVTSSAPRTRSAALSALPPPPRPCRCRRLASSSALISSRLNHAQCAIQHHAANALASSRHGQPSMPRCAARPTLVSPSVAATHRTAQPLNAPPQRIHAPPPLPRPRCASQTRQQPAICTPLPQSIRRSTHLTALRLASAPPVSVAAAQRRPRLRSARHRMRSSPQRGVILRLAPVRAPAAPAARPCSPQRRALNHASIQARAQHQHRLANRPSAQADADVAALRHAPATPRAVSAARASRQAAHAPVSPAHHQPRPDRRSAAVQALRSFDAVAVNPACQQHSGPSAFCAR